jgi:ligand-binding sensor domain-containing protein
MRLLFFLLFLSVAAQAQRIRYFTHFTEKDGLSHNYVRCILRDRQGYLWVGTANGLNRYDGYAFRQYMPDVRQPGRTISNEHIHDIKEDNNGFVWIATSNGLNRYDPRTETFQVWKNTGRNDGSLPNSLVRHIYIDNKNYLWLACDNRDLCRFDPVAGTFKTYPWKAFLDKTLPQHAGVEYKSIYKLQPRGDSGLWLHTNFGLFSFDPASETFRYYPLPKGSLPEAKPATCPNTLYLGSWDNDLLRYDACNNQWSQIKLPVTPDLIGGRRYVTLAFAYGEKHWVLGRDGLFLLDHATEKMTAVKPDAHNRFNTPTGLLENYYIEQNGMLWLGGEQGLWLLDPAAQQVHYTALRPENTNDFYNSFHRFTDSKRDGRRYLLDYYYHSLRVFENGKPLKNIPLPGLAAALFEDREGRLWIGSGPHIFQLDRKTLELHPFPVPSYLLDTTARSLFSDIEQDAAGNYWFANNTEGVLVWRPGKNEWWKPGEKEGFIGKAVSDVFADRERRTVWIATQDYGLFRYDESSGKFTLYRQEENAPEHSLGAYIVNAVCKDGQGYIWAATDPGGISRFDYSARPGKEFITLNNENGLPSNLVYSILTDDSGNVWAGTAKGLAWVNTRTLQVRSFGKKDGMVTDFLDLPLSLAANGAVLAGTVYGVQFFHPDSLLKEKVMPEILLTAFKIFDKNYADSLNINYLKKINLSWQQNFFSFEFASTNFSQPQKNEYAYRLQGFDKAWVYLKNRHSASYTNVPPGDYVLEIKSGREGRWYTPGIRLGIHIVPPFWATWWFRTLAVMVIAGAVWRFYRWRIEQIRREEALKTEFNQRIARTEMAALRAQMNPHFVFNCLSSINRFILVNKPDEASAYLTKFSRLIRLILDNSRTETVPLNKELDALQLYVEMEQMRFSDRFEYRLEISPQVQTEHVEVPPLLIQPFVENAIWHGLMHKKAPGLLQMRVFYEGKKLCIEVEDDGIGRQRAMELKSRSATVNKSLGMKVTAERLEVINQIYGTHAVATTEDLTDENGEAAGTRVRISF